MSDSLTHAPECGAREYCGTRCTDSPEHIERQILDADSDSIQSNDCLRSNKKETARAAAELLQHWQEKGAIFDKARLKAAVSHWGGRETVLEFRPGTRLFI